MKKLTKIFTMLVVAVIMALSVGAFAGCDNGENKWDKRTYEIYVYLADGTTPAESVGLALCYNLSDTSSNCLSKKNTDANGKVVFTIHEEATVVGNPVIHFTEFLGEYYLPTGYGMPANVGQVTMNDGGVYEYALTLTQKTTKLVLTVA